MSQLCRIEFLGSDGRWAHGHSGIALRDPATYAARLRLPGRVTVLDERLQPTDEVYLSPGAELI